MRHTKTSNAMKLATMTICRIMESMRALAVAYPNSSPVSKAAPSTAPAPRPAAGAGGHDATGVR